MNSGELSAKIQKYFDETPPETIREDIRKTYYDMYGKYPDEETLDEIVGVKNNG